jgi:hypothetical protein
MRAWKKELFKTFLIMSLPVYGAILWGLLFVMPYWYAWFFTNLIYTPIIYAINRFMVFRRIEKDVC